jgi:hypothetical protein
MVSLLLLMDRKPHLLSDADCQSLPEPLAMKIIAMEIRDHYMGINSQLSLKGGG